MSQQSNPISGGGSRQSGRWKQIEDLTLSEHEKSRGQSSTSGLSVGEIAQIIHRSEDSVKGIARLSFRSLV